jgi:branched-chain amino acid transport system permease protein
VNRLRQWMPPPMLGLFVLFLVLPAVLPWLGGYTYLGTEVMIWAIFALGYNLLLGYTGLPAFGHGAFFGMAGYFLGATQKWLTGGLWLPLLAGILGTCACGALVAVFVARRRGIYFSLLTISFGIMFWFLVFVLDTWTGGEDGLTGINRLAVGLPGVGSVALRGNTAFYYFVWALFAAVTVVLWRIVNSPFGHVLQAIRQSETRARALGYDTTRYKWMVFVLSCAFAGLAGGLYTLLRFGAFAEPMSLQQSGNVVLMCLIGGGFASFYGPVLGVGVFLVLRDVLSTLTDHWMLFYGLLFMAIILFMPEGILGVVKRLGQPAAFHDAAAAEAARREEEDSAASSAGAAPSRPAVEPGPPR